MNNHKPIAILKDEPNATSIYVRSKDQNKYFIMYDGLDRVRDDIAMNVIMNDRENDETIRQQQKLCNLTKINERCNQERLKCIRMSNSQLWLKFIESNDFFRACSEKEEIAECKIAKEEEMKKSLHQEIEDLEKKIDSLERFHKKFTNSINGLKSFEDVLEEVVLKMKLFKSKEDFIDRCDALLLAQTTISENNKSNLRSVAEMKFVMDKLSNHAALIIAGLENELNALQKMCERSSAECLKWENILVPTKDIIGEKERSAIMRLDQINQLHILLCNRIGVEPELKKNQIEEQLDFIKTEIETLQETIEMSNEMVATETRSDIAECGSNRSRKARK